MSWPNFLFQLSTLLLGPRASCLDPVVSSCAIAQVAFRPPFTVEAVPCEICDALSGTGARFSPNVSVLPCHCHFTSARYTFIHPFIYPGRLIILAVDSVVK